MSQIIVAQNLHGIVLAAENRAVQLDERGQEVALQVHRLLPLTSHAALVSVGAAEGIEMGNALKAFIQGEKLNDVQDLYGASLGLSLDRIRTVHEEEMRTAARRSHPSGFLHLGRKDGKGSEDAVPPLLPLDKEEAPATGRGRNLLRLLPSAQDGA